MARQGATFGLSGKALHLRLAENLAAQPRPAFGCEARDLGLIVALAVVVPLNVLALASGLGAASSLGLTAITLGLASVVRRGLRDKFGLDLLARRNRRSLPTRRAVPAMHGATPTGVRCRVTAAHTHR